MDSFPASDPPGWTCVRAGVPKPDRESRMGRPTHDDPDLNENAPAPPADGKRDAHKRQTPNDYKPQRPQVDDLRQLRERDRKPD